MEERKRLIKNTGIIAIGNLSTKVISFLLLPLYTSVLSTSEYGIVDYIVSISTFCVPFVSLLLDESIFRFLLDCKTEEEKKETISYTFFLLLISLCIFTIAGLVILFLINFDNPVLLILYVVSTVITTMISALLRGVGKTVEFAKFNFLTSVVNIVLNVILITVFRLGVVGMLSAFIISQISISLIYIFNMKLWLYVDLKIKKDVNKIKHMIKYSLPLIPNRISWSVINLSDRIIIMNSIGSSAAGLYAVSYKFPTLLDTVYGFFYQSWKESSARVIGTSEEKNFYNEVYDLLKNLLFSFVIIMIAFMPLAFKLLINSSFLEALLYVPILLLATYFSNISGFYGGIFTAYKDTNIMGITTLIGAIVNIIVNFLLIFKFGLYAAAISTLVSTLCIYLIRKNRVKKYMIFLENRKKSICGVFILAVSLILFYQNSLIGNLTLILIAISYFFFNNQKILKKAFFLIRQKRG